jgi:hypothetical protein
LYHHIPINSDKYQQLTARSPIPVGTELQPVARRSIPENPAYQTTIQRNSRCISKIQGTLYQYPKNTSAIIIHTRNTSLTIPKSFYTQAEPNQGINLFLSVENSKRFKYQQIPIPENYEY